MLVEDGKVIQVGWQGRGCVVSGSESMPSAYSIKVRGVVQGVGFRPFVYRLARANTLDRMGAERGRRRGDSSRRRRSGAADVFSKN